MPSCMYFIAINLFPGERKVLKQRVEAVKINTHQTDCTWWLAGGSSPPVIKTVLMRKLFCNRLSFRGFFANINKLRGDGRIFGQRAEF